MLLVAGEAASIWSAESDASELQTAIGFISTPLTRL